jgi:hypothetical protein
MFRRDRKPRRAGARSNAKCVAEVDDIARRLSDIVGPMAKLKLQQVPPKETIKQTLEQRLPQYQYSFRGNIIVCRKSAFIGAMVVPRKDQLIINGNFPSMGAMFVYIILLFGGGILIGLLVWLIAWKGGQDKVRDEVEATLKQAYQLPAAA